MRPHFRLDTSLPDTPGRPPWTLGPFEPDLLLRADDAGSAVLTDKSRVVRRFDGPLDALDWLDDARRDGTWVGFFAYELGGLLEPAAAGRPRHGLPVPLLAWGRVADAVPPPAGTPASLPSAVLRNAGAKAAYVHAVARCLDYIAAGDVFQVNFTRRIHAGYASTAAGLYDRLRTGYPAAFGGLIDLGDVAVVSNSPELLLHVDAGRRVVTRPIKGTRPRGPGQADALLASEKDAAELNMIVDLERNDLGRVCEVGSVRVTARRAVEAHPTVLHGVATVEGVLRPDVSLRDLLAATFPGGSVTGAPKIRAMQIIDQLEPEPRGVYCGAVGRLDPHGLTLNVAIRTMTLSRDGRLVIPVGGGVVADSVPADEWQETCVKAQAMLHAAGLAG